MSATLTRPELDTAQDAGTIAIRLFRAEVPQADLDDLRRRLQATRWPDKETVADRSQGAPLAKLQELVRYWATEYDWRAGEAKLNAFPQFKTAIDGVDVHFFHVRSHHPNALPLIVTHGWPGSVFEQLKIVGPLTDPTAFAGRAEDAFDVVIPSLPGFGFSSRPTQTGWGVERVARAWDVLMKRLGYAHYVAQGGAEWGVVACRQGRGRNWQNYCVLQAVPLGIASGWRVASASDRRRASRGAGLCCPEANAPAPSNELTLKIAEPKIWGGSFV
jgi:hypothetical protein